MLVRDHDERKFEYLRNASRDRALSLPRSSNSGLWKVTRDLSHAVDTWTWRCKLWREGDQLNWAAIGTDVVLGSAELTALSGDFLQVLLSWSIGIANLKEKTLITDWLAMEFADNLLADVAALKASKSNTTAVTLRVVKNSARDNSVVHEYRSKLSLVHVLWQVGNVKVGRALVTLGLETRVEGLSGKANLVSKLVKATNAQLGVANIEVLGETEALASTSGSVDDSLRGLNASEASSIGSEGLIVGIWVKTTDVNIAVTVDWVGQALLKSSHVLAGSEDGWDRWWDRWILAKESINVDAVSGILVWQWLNAVVRAEPSSWRWRGVDWRVAGTSDNGSVVAVTESIERSAWSRLVGRVRSAFVVETWNVLVLDHLMAISHITLALWVWHDRVTWHVAWVCSLWSVESWRVGVRSISKLSGTYWLLEDVVLWHAHDLAVHVEVLWSSTVNGWHGSSWLLNVGVRNVEVSLSEGTNQVGHAVVGRGCSRSWVSSGLSLSVTLSLSLSLSMGGLLSVHVGSGKLVVVLGRNLGLLVRHGPLVMKC